MFKTRHLFAPVRRFCCVHATKVLFTVDSYFVAQSGAQIQKYSTNICLVRLFVYFNDLLAKKKNMYIYIYMYVYNN